MAGWSSDGVDRPTSLIIKANWLIGYGIGSREIVLGQESFAMMKIEYLESGSEDCPLFRLFEFDESDVEALREVCLSLAADRITEFRLDSQSWVESIGQCHLVLRSGGKNIGARWGKRVTDAFTIEFNSEGWLEVADKIQPLTNCNGGYQWLVDEGDFNVLLSWDGCW